MRVYPSPLQPVPPQIRKSVNELSLAEFLPSVKGSDENHQGDGFLSPLLPTNQGAGDSPGESPPPVPGLGPYRIHYTADVDTLSLMLVKARASPQLCGFAPPRRGRRPTPHRCRRCGVWAGREWARKRSGGGQFVVWPTQRPGDGVSMPSAG